VRLAEQRLAHESDADSLGCGGDGCAQPCASSADDQYIVIYGFETSHVSEEVRFNQELITDNGGRMTHD
jgi:hypothetical protein